MKRIILGFCPTPLLTGRVWFDCDQVFRGFELFSQIQDEFEIGSGIVTPVLHRLYFKNIFLLFYFIL